MLINLQNMFLDWGESGQPGEHLQLQEEHAPHTQEIRTSAAPKNRAVVLENQCVFWRFGRINKKVQ